MKKIFATVAFAAIFAACNSNTKTNEQAAIPQADTTGLAQFKAWKQQQEFIEQSRMYSGFDDQQNLQGQEALVAPATQPTREVVREKVVYRDRPAARSSSVSSSSGSNSSGTLATAPAQEKKGWSKAAKGTAIGAGSGAVLGAIVNKKNRAAGAVIGGVVGGAGGYIIGRSKDKKDGRY
jgi:hypothetical protein